VNTGNIWLGSRLSRRRLVRGGAVLGAGLAGAALVGCGGGDDAQPAAPAPAQSAATPTPKTAAPAGPKRGGIYRVATTADPPTLDPYGSGSFATKGFAAHIYSRLFRIDAQPDTNPYDQGVIPDLAEKFETKDGQSWVVTLKRGVKFHDVAPVSGRELTTDDVLFSWKRLTDPKSVNRSAVEAVTKAEAVDRHTLRFELKAPSPIFIEILADANNFFVMPAESDGKFQPTVTPIGTGPWMLDSYQVSSRFKYKRNPAYFVEGVPYLDGIDVPIIPEYANSKAQFEAGNLDALGIISDDVIDLHKRHSAWQWVGLVTGGVAYLFFSPPDKDPNAPWRDERYRQAASMAFDRSAIMELSYNVKALKAAGLDPSDKWNNIVGVTMAKWWLDPQSAAHGPTGKFFRFDAAEARKLLAAAGGEKTPIKYQYASPVYGVTFDRAAEAIGNYLRDAGFPATTEIQDYTAVYFPNTRAGNFNGVALGATPAYPEVTGYVDRYFSKTSSNASKVDDPQLNDLRAKQSVEFDGKKRLDLIHSIQRRNAEMMFYTPTPVGGGSTWTAYQKRVRGVANTRGYGAPTEVTARIWLDA